MRISRYPQDSSETDCQVCPRGFTLVELLVALGITASLAALMLSITMSTLKLWNRSTGHLQSSNDARLVLDAITADLQAAILRRDANAWLVATLQRDQSTTGDTGMQSTLLDRWNPRAGSNGRVKPGATESLRIDPASARLEDCRFGQAGVWLRFFSTPSDNASSTAHNASAPRAIAYRLVRCRPSNGLARYYLFRSEVRPFHNGGSTIGDSTFEVGYNLLMPTQTPPKTDDNPSPSRVPGYNDAYGTDQSTGNITRPTAARVIATEVVDFGIRLHERAPDGTLRETFPCRRDANGSPQAGEPNKTAPFSYAASATNQHTKTDITGPIVFGYPVVAEIFIRILTPQGFKILQVFEEEDADRFPSQTWWDIVEQHSQVFTRRIAILAAPL